MHCRLEVLLGEVWVLLLRASWYRSSVGYKLYDLLTLGLETAHVGGCGVNLGESMMECVM